MIEAANQGWRLQGPLTLPLAHAALAEGEAAWPPPNWTIDLGGLTQVDSVALSVLLSWQRRAAAESQQLRLYNAPVAMRALANVYGVEDIIGLEKPT